MNEPRQATPITPLELGTVVKTLVMTDLVGSTTITEILGDEKAAEVFNRRDILARRLLREFGGREIDKTDGFLMLFERPLNAAWYSIAYHTALGELGDEVGVELSERVGIHVGEVILRNNDPEDVDLGAKRTEVEGLSKPFTARLMSLAMGGQTLMTRGAFDLARRGFVGAQVPGGKSLRWLSHGTYSFDGIEEDVEVFEVGVFEDAPLRPPPANDKVRRTVSDDTLPGWRPAPEQEIPQRPHWVLERKLGEGGYGEVWLAVHRGTRGRRTYKFCQQAESLRSLKREVTLFRLLKETLGDRDDIARVLDWNFDEHPYFIESQYTSGGNLKEWAEGQGGLSSLSLEDRLEIVAQVAEALGAAHSVGVLHKDVKPGNLLVNPDRDGRPTIQLTDFGISLLTDTDSLAEIDLTHPTSLADLEDLEATQGTRLYMAPEILEGKVPSVQSDIYSLGVILYQMMVGDFSRAVATGWEREIDDEILREDLSLMLDGSPNRRERDARQIARQLRDLEKRRRKRVRAKKARVIAGQLAQKRARSRKRRKVFALAGMALALVASILTFQQLRLERQTARDQAQAIDNKIDQAQELRAHSESLKASLFGENDPEEHSKTPESYRDLTRTNVEHEWVRTLQQSADAYTVALTLPNRSAHRVTECEGLLAETYFELLKAAETLGESLLADRAEQMSREYNRGRDPELDRYLDGVVDFSVTVLEGVEGAARIPAPRLQLFRYFNAPLESNYRFRRVPVPVEGRGEEGVFGLGLRPDWDRLDLSELEVPGAEEWEPGAKPVTLDPPPNASQKKFFLPSELDSIARGSYLLVVDAEGFATTRYPFEVGRSEKVELEIPLLRPEEIPDGFVFVPGGESILFGGETNTPYSKKEQRRRVGPFLMKRTEVTEGEYLAFLNGLRRDQGWAPNEIRRLVPRNRQSEWRIPRSEEAEIGPSDNPNRPVTTLSIVDADLYTRWLTEETGRNCRLPTEVEWERAARGADGRLYPWGNLFVSEFCFHRATPEGGGRIPSRTGGSPADRSPFGILDLSGSVIELCGPIVRENEEWINPAADEEDEDPKTFFARGGGFASGLPHLLSTTVRLARGHGAFHQQIGFRVVCEIGDRGH